MDVVTCRAKIQKRIVSRAKIARKLAFFLETKKKKKKVVEGVKRFFEKSTWCNTSRRKKKLQESEKDKNVGSQRILNGNEKKDEATQE